MRCKPPCTSTATAWSLVAPAACSPLHMAGKSEPRTAPGERNQVMLGRSPMACRLRPRLTDQHRRNAVGAHGVKLDAAPDAPPWGEVLACLPVPVRIQRRAVAATDTHPPPHRHTRQARTVRGGAGCEKVRTRPAVWACRDSPLSALVLVPASAPVLATATRAANGGPRMSAGREIVPAGCGTARR